MGEILTRQAQMIESGTAFPFPLNKRVFINGLPMQFSTQEKEVTVRQVPLGQNNLEVLIPDAQIHPDFDFTQALVIEKEGYPMVAILTGVDTVASLPVATMFNLTRPEDLRVVVKGRTPQALKNDNQGIGFTLSMMLRGNPNSEMLQITSDSQSLFVEVVKHVP